nr:hypothetical protein GCM10017610_22700 [Curtobacterium pusillum]
MTINSKIRRALKVQLTYEGHQRMRGDRWWTPTDHRKPHLETARIQYFDHPERQRPSLSHPIQTDE